MRIMPDPPHHIGFVDSDPPVRVASAQKRSDLHPEPIMTGQTIRLALGVLLILLLPAPPALAQIGGSGSIQGTVLDASKAPLPGVTMTATNVATGVETVRQTTDAGVYVLTPLQPGEYRVTASLDVPRPPADGLGPDVDSDPRAAQRRLQRAARADL
jgi:hypothetical protein